MAPDGMRRYSCVRPNGFRLSCGACEARRAAGPDRVVLRLKDLEALLLGPPGGRRGAGRRPLERPVHPFVPAVLLRMSRIDQFRVNPQLDPPHAQLRQPSEGLGGERDAVVGPENLGQAVFLKESPKHRRHSVVVVPVSARHPSR
jgi:hypothetical protein